MRRRHNSLFSTQEIIKKQKPQYDSATATGDIRESSIEMLIERELWCDAIVGREADKVNDAKQADMCCLCTCLITKLQTLT
jgi:hypothetical protein